MADAKKALTDREMYIMARAWESCDEPPKINYETLMSKVGMTNPRSAANAWRVIQKKLAAMKDGDDESGEPAEGGDGTTPKKATPKATPKKRGKSAAADGDSPAKKAKGRKGKAIVKEEEPSAEDNGETEMVEGEAVKPETGEE